MAGKKGCSTGRNSEPLKYPLSSPVAALSHFLYNLIKGADRGYKCNASNEASELH